MIGADAQVEIAQVEIAQVDIAQIEIAQVDTTSRPRPRATPIWTGSKVR